MSTFAGARRDGDHLMALCAPHASRRSIGCHACTIRLHHVHVEAYNYTLLDPSSCTFPLLFYAHSSVVWSASVLLRAIFVEGRPAEGRLVEHVMSTLRKNSSPRR